MIADIPCSGFLNNQKVGNGSFASIYDFPFLNYCRQSSIPTARN